MKMCRPRSNAVAPFHSAGAAITQPDASEGCANATHRQKQPERKQNRPIVDLFGK